MAYRDGSRLLGHLPMRVGNAVTLCQMLGSGIRGIYFYGPAGTFKTSIAASYLASQVRGGAHGLYTFVPDLMADIHESYRNDEAESRTELVDRRIAVPCLVLDDLGKEKASEHGAGVIFEILDGRYREHRKGDWLIVTSNYPMDELCDRFPEHLGEPIRRRLGELTVSYPMDGTV